MPSDVSPYRDTVEELRRLASGGGQPPPVEPEPLPADDPGMEQRLKRVEDDVRAIRGDLSTIIGRLSAVEGKLDLLLAQVVSKIPSGLQMLGIILGTLMGTVTILGAAVALAQWLHLIPRT